MVDVEARQMNTLPVAETILEQLGGHKFRVMTGAHHFLGSATRLTFKLPGGCGFCKNGINFVSIELMPDDTYDVTFSRMRFHRDGNITTTFTSIHHNIYFDTLQELFTRETGLAVRL
jgi:hypothetical protein